MQEIIDTPLSAEALSEIAATEPRPLGDEIRANPRPILQFTFVALVGMLGGFIVGYAMGLGH